MAIRETLDVHSFVNRFMQLRDNFSSPALVSLFHYYEDISEAIGEDLEFDPIAICTEWTEYRTYAECLENYDQIESIDELYNLTVVLPVVDNTQNILVQNF